MTKRIQFSLFFLAMMLLLFHGCTNQTTGTEDAIASITSEDLKKDVEILSSDEFEGRSPASKGEELTIEFLKNGFPQYLRSDERHHGCRFRTIRTGISAAGLKICSCSLRSNTG